MKVQIVILLISLCIMQVLTSQEGDGVIAFSLPLRNSLTFNRYLINPTFSFVREQTKFINITNKREWAQFNDAPQSYIANFGGRFEENIGAGVSLFQQNYGILTSFGGILNFAYNARIARSTNLTFGLNLGAYQSGVDTSKAITNFDDPALQNVPQNFLMTVEPAINFGTEFFDFGLSFKNLVLYNFESSELLQDDPQQGIQAHVMYTGYMASRGFFDNSKFTGFLRSEFYSDDTIISGLAMLTVPMGIWAQLGYNSLYGISGGIGINITKQIAAEYNFETGVGDISSFGASHEITLAYRFTPNRRLYYSNDDEVAGLISSNNRKRSYKKSTNSNTDNNRVAQQNAQGEVKAKAQTEVQRIAEEETRKEAEAKVQAEAKRLAEEKAKQEAEAKAQAEAKRLAEEKAKQEAEAKAQAEARRLAEEKAKQEAEAKAQAEARRLAEEKAKQEAEAKAQAEARQLAEEKAKQEAEARRLAEEKAKQEAEAMAQLETQRLAEAALVAESVKQEKTDSTNVEEIIKNSTDKRTMALQSMAEETIATSVDQDNLLKELDSMVLVKDADLKALKEENDLTEQGIAVKPRPFKSITAENNRLNQIKTDLDDLISTRDKKIKELEELYEETIIGDTITNEVVMLYYKKEIKRLKAEQAKAVETKARLNGQLETIRIATEFERRRRIKRAAFDNEDERYLQDRATLKNIRETTVINSGTFDESDFDFGEDQGNNIKILKNINNAEEGYYMILAVHSSVERRDEFLRKVVASGNKSIDFFYDVNTSKYYIYNKKHNNINEATRALESKGSLPYNSKMSVVKIEK